MKQKSKQQQKKINRMEKLFSYKQDKEKIQQR